MNRQRFTILTLLLAFFMMAPQMAVASDKEEEGLNVKEVMFHHLGDGYGWEVPFSHLYRIPLPVIVKTEDGKWVCFSSSRLSSVEEVTDPATGEVKFESVPQIVNVDKDGKQYQFVLAHVSKHSNKIVQIFPITDAEQSEVFAKTVATSDKVVDGYVEVDGKYYREYRPFDISVTKNVFALFISVVLVILMVMSVVRYYSRKGFKAPRKGMGFMELLIDFIYSGMIKPTLKDNSKKYAPLLLTLFFFILTMNLLGLIVIFPGGANLTGNISVTLVLALVVFVVTNVTKSKHYWKEIFWPDVPLFLKFPLPIMQFIEIFGIFTKPAALCVRLFANMMGGHMIVITLTLLIFIFTAFGMYAAGGSVVVSILFSVFMLALDVLVSFIQAYVFTLLSTLFISMSHDNGHESHAEKGSHEDPAEVASEKAPATIDI